MAKLHSPVILKFANFLFAIVCKQVIYGIALLSKFELFFPSLVRCQSVSQIERKIVGHRNLVRVKFESAFEENAMKEIGLCRIALPHNQHVSLCVLLCTRGPSHLM